jgi:WD40 repeat protein
VLPLAAAAAAGRPYPAAAAPLPPGARLLNPAEVTVKDLRLYHAALLADNDSVAVVGTTDLRELADPETAPPGGAIVNLKTKSVRRFTNGHRAGIWRVACTGDGSRLVTGSSAKDKILGVWDVQAGKPLDPVDLSAFDVSGTLAVACGGRGRQVAVELGDRVAVFDLARPGARVDLTAEFFSGNNGPGDPALSPDGRYAACTTTRKEVVVWDVAARRVVCAPALLPEGVDRSNCQLHPLCFTKSGRGLIVCRQTGGREEVPKGKAEKEVPAERRALQLIDPANGRITPLGMGHELGTRSFALHPSEEWVATVGQSRPKREGEGGVEELRVYHYPSRTLALRLQFDDFHPIWVGFTRDGKRLVAVSHFGQIKCWDFSPAS